MMSRTSIYAFFLVLGVGCATPRAIPPPNVDRFSSDELDDILSRVPGAYAQLINNPQASAAIGGGLFQGVTSSSFPPGAKTVLTVQASWSDGRLQGRALHSMLLPASAPER